MTRKAKTAEADGKPKRARRKKKVEPKVDEIVETVEAVETPEISEAAVVDERVPPLPPPPDEPSLGDVLWVAQKEGDTALWEIRFGEKPERNGGYVYGEPKDWATCVDTAYGLAKKEGLQFRGTLY